LSGATQLSDQTTFHECAGDLAHHFAAEIIAVGEVIAGRGQEPDTTLRQQGNAQLLHNQVTYKTAGILDNDRSDAVTLDAVEEPCEPHAPSWLGSGGLQRRSRVFLQTSKSQDCMCIAQELLPEPNAM
jgi:hypothetical protein